MNNDSKGDREEFDYIVVGSGTAGCVLANRLSEDDNVTVCMIEAGPPDKSPRVHIPSAVATLLFDKKMGWDYWTVPQKHLDGRVIPVPRGRVLGGCSSTNGMVPQPADRALFILLRVKR